MKQRLSQSLAAAREHQNLPTQLELTGLRSIPSAQPDQVLIKLRRQGDPDYEKAFLQEHKLEILARLPLPGNPYHEQVVLQLRMLEPSSILVLKRDPRVCYVVPNSLYLLETQGKSTNGNGLISAFLRTTDAARLLRSITNAERLGTKIKAASWSDNLALEDALRRSSHCLELVQQPRNASAGVDPIVLEKVAPPRNSAAGARVTLYKAR